MAIHLYYKLLKSHKIEFFHSLQILKFSTIDFDIFVVETLTERYYEKLILLKTEPFIE